MHCPLGTVCPTCACMLDRAYSQGACNAPPSGPPQGHPAAPSPTWAPCALPTIPAVNSLRCARRPSTREVKAAVPGPAGGRLCSLMLATAQRRPRAGSADCSAQTVGGAPLSAQSRLRVGPVLPVPGRLVCYLGWRHCPKRPHLTPHPVASPESSSEGNTLWDRLTH